MYVLKFDKNKKVELDYSLTYSIFDGLGKMREWNKDAKASEDTFIMHYKIIDDVKDQAILVDKMVVGAEYNYDFFGTTRNRLKNLFEGEELEENLTLLEKIEAQYEAEKDKHYANFNAEIQENIVSSPENTEDIEEEKSTSKFKKTVGKLKKSSSKKSFHSDKQSQKEEKGDSLKETLIAKYNDLDISKNALLTIVGAAALTFIVGVVVVANLISPNNEPQPFEELLQDHYFIEALEEYPHRYVEINQEIMKLDEEGIPFLEEFIQHKDDYAPAHLDLAYLNRNYEQVIALEEYADTDQRRGFVVSALIHEENFEEATEIERLIRNDLVNQDILDEYLSLIIEHLTRNDIESAVEVQEHANHILINDFMTEYIELEEEIESQSVTQSGGFFNRNNLDDLRSERSNLLNKSTLFEIEEESSSGLIVSIILLIISIGIIISLVIYYFKKKKKPHAKIKDFENMIKNKLFVEALKLYPHKYPEIEREIFLLGEKGIPYLEEFISHKKGYKPALFDLAFLKKDYEKVIKLEEYADTDGRKSQLAISYIRNSQIDKANEINQYIEVPELAYYLNEHYYQLTVEALKNDDMLLAREYQEKGKSTDIDYLIGTIQLIEEKIESIVNGAKKLGLNAEEKNMMKKLEEARATSLNLD